MRVGQQIVCQGNRGYMLTEGKTYEVHGYEPPYRSEYFTWPAYVQVTDDYGTKVWCHATRFTTTRSKT